jgi:glycine/D-amino acid oxidase-like deaminating enzyme
MSTEPLAETERPALLTTQPAISDTHGDLFFFHPLADGRLVTGGGLIFRYDWERRLRRRIEQRVRMVFPQVKTVRFDHVWHGRIAMTPEYLPRLHRLAPGVFSVLGYCGRGVALSVAMGQVLTGLLGGEPEEALPLPFAPLRPLPLHGLLSGAAPLLLQQRRWRDAREVRA